jgi:hypothetical protein
MAFVGDGSFSGDGGPLLEQLWSKWPWRPAKNEPGRYSMKKVGDGVPPEALCETAGIAKVKVEKKDNNIVIIELDGGGGLVTVANPDGSYVHTLNTKSCLEAYRATL